MTLPSPYIGVFSMQVKWVIVQPNAVKTNLGMQMLVPSQGRELCLVTKSPIVLSVGAELDQLPVMRSMAEVLGVLGDFNLDDVADIKLAIDEVCSQLLIGAAAETELTASFMLSESDLTAAVSARVVSSYSLPRDGFGWRVLTTVADAVKVTETVNDAPRDREIVVEIVKRRSGR